MSDQEPYHRAIMALDIEGFGRSERSNPDRVELCGRLQAALTRSLAAAGIGEEHCKISSTGDGRLLTVHPIVSKARLLGPLVTFLHAELTQYNQGASAVAQVRLRMVVHAGEILWDSDAPIGDAVNFAFRLLDSDQARDRLRHTIAPMVVIVSDWIYREVVRHGYLGIDPRRYRPIRVVNKDVRTYAWLHIPGELDDDPGPGSPAGRRRLLGQAPSFRRWASDLWTRTGRGDRSGDRLSFGLHDLVRDLLDGLDDPAGGRPVVLWAPTGSGKTEALLRLAAIGDSRERRTAVDAAPGAGGGEIPARRGIDILLQVARKEPEEVAIMLATAAQLDASDPETVAERLLACEGPLTIAIDGLDEAIDAPRLTRDLLRPLAIGGGRVGVRLLITADVPAARLFGSDVECVDIDTAPYFNRRDVADCAYHTLVTTTGPGSAFEERPAIARTAADSIASWAGRNFLVAQLAAAACGLAGPDRLGGFFDSSGKPAVSPTVGAALDWYLDQLGSDRTRAVDLLSALAWAEGDGIADDTLWAAFATALSRRRYEAEDVRWLRTTPADQLLEASFHDGLVTYRIAHTLVAAHLRAGTDAAAAHRAITDALREQLPTDPDTGRVAWAANAYHRRYLATHAMRAGRLHELLRDPAFVLDADPIRLRSALHGLHGQPGGTDDDAWVARLGQYADDRLRYRHGSNWWAAYLHLAAIRHGQDAFAADVLRLGRPMPWIAQWTKRFPDVGQPAGPTNHLWAVSTMRLAEGRRIVIYGADNGAIELVALTTGESVGPPFSGHIGPAWTLAGGRLANGRALAVSGGADGAIWVWDLDTALQTARRDGVRLGSAVGASDGPITALTMAEHPDGRRILISGAMEEPSVRLWGLEGTRPATTALSGHDKWIQAAVAAVTGDGEFVAITGDAGGRLLMWSLDRGVVLDELPGHPGGVGAVEIVTMPGRGQFVVSTGADGRIRLWDLERRSPIDELTAYPADWPETVAIVRLAGGRPVLATGGRSGLVTLWDLASMAPIEQVKLDGPVRDLAGSGDGMLLVAQQDGLVALRLQPGGGASEP